MDESESLLLRKEKSEYSTGSTILQRQRFFSLPLVKDVNNRRLCEE